MPAPATPDLAALARQIKVWGMELGFQQVGITGTSLPRAEQRLNEWLAAGYHGELGYMARHGRLRTRPEELHPGTCRVIIGRMDYRTREAADSIAVLANPEQGFLARYALGRDYHKVLRQRLRTLAARIEASAGPHGHRVFVDSAPVLEKPLAQAAGLGWIGKHTNLINREAGSWFLLGEIFTDLPLPVDAEAADHCGSCRACLDICPTRAIVAPYVLDARRCIAYFTIESRGPIPEELRPPMGNRIFGCDDCQLACPWNKFAGLATVADFSPRQGLDAPRLLDLFRWSEEEWRQRTEGSALRRAGYTGWLRNVAVALGNGTGAPGVRAALAARLSHASALVREHVAWALARLDRHSGGGADGGSS
jgi:epoxyqueuosine reductase